MLSNGNDPIIRPASATFTRRPGQQSHFGRWLAAVPIAVVAAFTFNASAPAGTTPEETSTEMLAQADARWSVSDARQLLQAVEASAAEGLDPANYGVAALRAAIEADRAGPALDGIATNSALRLAHDYADGRIEDKAALDWKIGTPVDATALSAALDEAIAKKRVAEWLKSLLPDNEQYRALKAAYAQAGSNEADRTRLRANLERWRWMPRDLGQDYLYVNVPAYRLSVMSGGTEMATYNVVVGSPKTPTPQLALRASSVVANPSWTVPESIARKGTPNGRGFRWTKMSDGKPRLWQAPGVTNALGRIKIDMPNPDAIYLHDTPNRTVFNRENRALSHGCIRVENIEALAASLQGGSGLDEALSDPTKTRVFQLQRSVPVYLAYFTAEAGPDGSIRYLDDPYGRDKIVLAKLGPAGGASPTVMAAR